MISDVPLGAFLSGGVDSSAVVAMMAQLSPQPVKTFSIGFPQAEYDETRYARMVAARYGTDHQELILEPHAADVLPKLIWHYNEPYADASMIPTYYVSEMTRRHVTVALNGDGGDEAFIGYPRYDTVRKLAELDYVPAAWASRNCACAAFIAPARSSQPIQLAARIARPAARRAHGKVQPTLRQFDRFFYGRPEKRSVWPGHGGVSARFGARFARQVLR